MLYFIQLFTCRCISGFRSWDCLCQGKQWCYFLIKLENFDMDVKKWRDSLLEVM